MTGVLFCLGQGNSGLSTAVDLAYDVRHELFVLSMKALEATLVSYAKQHLPTLPNDYLWKFDPEVVLTDFGVTVTGATWYDKTRALKRGLSQVWSSRPNERTALADYAVRVWGGVKRNAPTTMGGYVQTVSQGAVPQSHKGIASWSKVAAFSDPGKHAIFDARVSFSLNAIQLLSGGGQCWWFPHLAGRNKLLVETWPVLKTHAAVQKWTPIDSKQVYSTYIALLTSVARSLRTDIDDVEMLLFAKAEELARAVNATNSTLGPALGHPLPINSGA